MPSPRGWHAVQSIRPINIHDLRNNQPPWETSPERERDGRYVFGPLSVLGAVGHEVGCTTWGTGVTFPFKHCYSGIFLVHLPQQMPPRGEQTLLAPAWPPSRQSASHLFVWLACLCLAPCSHWQGDAEQGGTGLTTPPGPVPSSSPPILKFPGAPLPGSPPPASVVPRTHQD